VTTTLAKNVPFTQEQRDFTTLVKKESGMTFFLHDGGKNLLIPEGKLTYDLRPLGGTIEQAKFLTPPAGVARITPDGRFWVLTEGASRDPSPKPWRVMGWDSTTKTVLWTAEFPAHYDGLYPQWAISADGRRVAVTWSASPDPQRKAPYQPGICVVLEVVTGKEVRRRASPASMPESLTGLALAADGRSVVSTTWDSSTARTRINRLVRWDIEQDTETPILVFEETKNTNASVELRAVSPDGRLAALRNARFELLLVELATGAVRSRFVAPDHISWVAFSPDGRHAVLSCSKGRGDGIVVVVDTETNREVMRKLPPAEATVAVTPDGRKLVMACFGGIFSCDMPAAKDDRK
jgi:dipeptidyl aminopeptidase/acylaminoacyl peptidase